VYAGLPPPPPFGPPPPGLCADTAAASPRRTERDKRPIMIKQRVYGSTSDWNIKKRIQREADSEGSSELQISTNESSKREVGTAYLICESRGRRWTAGESHVWLNWRKTKMARLRHSIECCREYNGRWTASMDVSDRNLETLGDLSPVEAVMILQEAEIFLDTSIEKLSDSQWR
jgi:hypothetical protein